MGREVGENQDQRRLQGSDANFLHRVFPYLAGTVPYYTLYTNKTFSSPSSIHTSRANMVNIIQDTMMLYIRESLTPDTRTG